MRTGIIAALTLLTTALSIPAATAAAQPHTHVHAQPQGPRHGDAIRYASIKGCPLKGGGTRPCGDWRLVMHSGERTTLPDAQGVAREADGSSSRYYPAAIAVSGNGQRVAYLSKKGRLAVRTLGGEVLLLTKDALPKVAQHAVRLRLSDDGARLAVILERETRIFDTRTGELRGTVPAEASVVGFSGDGDELLTTVNADSAIDLVVYGLTGQERRRATPPQVIAVNQPQALAGDGRTVASVVTGGGAELVTYDMEGDQVADRKRIKLPAGQAHMVDWTGDTQVTVHLITHTSGPDRMTIAQIDTGTGKVKIRDRYTTLADTFAFAACGG